MQPVKRHNHVQGLEFETLKTFRGRTYLTPGLKKFLRKEYDECISKIRVEYDPQPVGGNIRVLLYKFNPEWNATTIWDIAEDVCDDETYLRFFKNREIYD